jgi:hypothetical protein
MNEQITAGQQPPLDTGLTQLAAAPAGQAPVYWQWRFAFPTHKGPWNPPGEFPRSIQPGEVPGSRWNAQFEVRDLFTHPAQPAAPADFLDALQTVRSRLECAHRLLDLATGPSGARAAFHEIGKGISDIDAAIARAKDGQP